MTQPPRPAGVMAPAIVRPIVVSFSGASILSEKIWQASDRRAGVERLEAVVDQVANLGAALRAVVANRLAGQRFARRMPGRPGSAMRQGLDLLMA